VTAARDEAVAQGITINGLPLMLNRPSSYWDVTELDVYYKNCVIGGPGAFIHPVRDAREFPHAIRAKIIREIADRSPSLIHFAQASGPATGCLAGELRREP
jgi:hypothetical protein